MAVFTFSSPVETHSPWRVAQFLLSKGLVLFDGVSIDASGFVITADLSADPGQFMLTYTDAPTLSDQADTKAANVLQAYVTKYAPMSFTNTDDQNAILALCRLLRRMSVS